MVKLHQRIKKGLMALVLVCLPVLVWGADWEKIDGLAQYELDKSSIHKSPDGSVTAWIKDPAGKKLIQCACPSHQYSYAIGQTEDFDLARSLQPDSDEETIFNTLCKKGFFSRLMHHS
jgi:hypothetical protein